MALVDLRLEGDSGLRFLDFCKGLGVPFPCVCFSGEADYSEAIKAFRKGATEVLQKPVSPARLVDSIQRAHDAALSARRAKALMEASRPAGHALIGSSAPIKNLRLAIDQATPSDAKVLILGETGTGKEIVASMIHAASRRSSGPLVVAATSRDLGALVQRGLFRPDLLYRLNVLELRTPPLREIKSDLPSILTHFIALQQRKLGAAAPAVDAEAWTLINAYDWNGNCRELRNFAERLLIVGLDAALRSLPGAKLSRPASETGALAGSFAAPLPTEAAPVEIVPWRSFKREAERAYLDSVLNRCQWNVSEAARKLELDRVGLHQKIASLGLRRDNE